MVLLPEEELHDSPSASRRLTARRGSIISQESRLTFEEVVRTQKDGNRSFVGRMASQMDHAHAHGVRLELEDDNEQVAWHLQGDDDMYSAEALDRRFLLRHTPSVAVKLEEWWEVVAAHLRAVGKDDTELDKSEYFWIFRKIYRAMIDEYVEEEAETTLAEDWASDSGGRDALSPRQFMDAIFEWRARLDAHSAFTPSWQLFYVHPAPSGPQTRRRVDA